MNLEATRSAHRAMTIAAALALSTCAPAPLQPPETRRDDTVEIVHGTEIRDPYRWLEDQNSPETRDWIDRQAAYTRRVLAEAPVPDAVRKLK